MDELIIKSKILSALEKGDSAEQIQQLCRDIISEEIQTKYAASRERSKLLEIISKLQIPIKVSSQQIDSADRTLNYYTTSLLTLCGGLLAMALSAKIFNYHPIRLGILFGAIAGGGIAYGLPKTLQKHHPCKPPSKSEIILSSPDVIFSCLRDIENFVDFYFSSTLLNENENPTRKEVHILLHEGRYKEILISLRRLYGSCDRYGTDCKMFIQKYIEVLLADAGYELIDYSDIVENGFDVEYANSISEPRIAYKAIGLINGGIVERGKIYMPKK